MKAVVEPLEGNKVKLSVEVDEQEFEKALDAAFRKIAREVRIPGFRPGKAPRQLLEARIGADAAREEALRESLPDFYAQALAEHDVDAIAPPEIDITAGEEAGPSPSTPSSRCVPAGHRRRLRGPPGHRARARRHRRGGRRARSTGCASSTASSSAVEPARPATATTSPSTCKGYRHDEPVEGSTPRTSCTRSAAAPSSRELDEQLRGAKVGDILKFNATVGDGEEASPSRSSSRT